MQPASSLSITNLSACELATLIRQKQLSPVEVIEAHLSRIQRLNPTLNAFVGIDEEQARVAARRVEDELMRGENSKPLLGVPVSIKSCIDVQGLKCEAGSRLRDGYIAAEDAPLVKRLKQA